MSLWTSPCISIEDTEALLLAYKLHCSILDGLPAWFLRENAELISRPLCSVFNVSLREDFVPTVWKSANVTSIPKISPALDVRGFRFPSHFPRAHCKRNSGVFSVLLVVAVCC